MGISSGVSSQAKPNIRPWSPAPPVSTPMAISSDCFLMAQMTPQVSESKPYLARVVANVLDDFARQISEIDIGLGGDFAGDDHQPSCNECFAGNAAHRVVCHNGVENGVGNLIGNFVGMALGDGLRGKQELLISMRQNSILPRNESNCGGRI